MMNYLAQTKIPDINCGFRAMRRDIIRRYLHLCSDRFSFSMSSTLALVSEGHGVRFVPVHSSPRQSSASQVRVFTGFDAFLTLLRLTIVFHPLRVFMPISLLLCILGSAFLIHDLIYQDISDTMVICSMSSLLVFLFGLLSDQVARIRREMAIPVQASEPDDFPVRQDQESEL